MNVLRGTECLQRSVSLLGLEKREPTDRNETDADECQNEADSTQPTDHSRTSESLLDSAVTEKVLERVRRMATGSETDELGDLTVQERKILLLVAEGKTNKEIAGEVFLSDKTVKNYVSSILSKLNLQRRAQAAAFMAKRRLPIDAKPPDRTEVDVRGLTKHDERGGIADP
ncbi:MAG: response regulator transcription factor [Candidatus Limnocylindrales bacterium]